jgi:hypothetical protein
VLTFIPAAEPFSYPDVRAGLHLLRREFPRTYRLYADDDARKRPNKETMEPTAPRSDA